MKNLKINALSEIAHETLWLRPLYPRCSPLLARPHLGEGRALRLPCLLNARQLARPCKRRAPHPKRPSLNSPRSASRLFSNASPFAPGTHFHGGNHLLDGSHRGKYELSGFSQAFGVRSRSTAPRGPGGTEPWQGLRELPWRVGALLHPHG